MRLVGLLLRRHRVGLLAWTLSLLALVAVTVPAYEATYPDLSARGVLVEQMAADQGSRVLYGPLGTPGTYGQLFAWESGTYLLLLASVAAILLGVALTRGEEDAGAVELVRSVGVGPGAPVRAGLVVLTLFCLVVGGGTAAILLAQADAEELGATGGLGFGGLTFLTAWAFGLVAVAAAQLRGDAPGARHLALLVLGMSFALRAVADTSSAGWASALSWASPLGWKAVLSPWTEDRLWTLVAMLAVGLALAGLGLWCASRREVGGALLGRPGGSGRRLRVRSVPGWALAEARGSLVGWTVGVLGVALLFGSMAEGLAGTLEEDPTIRDLVEQMGVGLDDPVQTYFTLLGSMVAVVAVVGAVAQVLRWRSEESSGRLVQELATGVPRWRSLLARAGVAAVAGVLWLGAGGLLMGLLGRVLLADVDPFGPALRGTLGEAPGLLAAVGLATLLVAVLPRVSALVSWVMVGWSAFVLWFGELVDLPGMALDATLLGHAAGVSEWVEGLGGESWQPWDAGGLVPLAVLGAVAVLGLALGALLLGRRDLRLG